MRRPLLVVAALSTALLASPAVEAFCGFYVSGADAKLFNNATQVVLMREGTRTVLSMQNNYQGPPENFAMVIPVPVVLQKENVKTLSKEIFDRVDQLTAPRLVEYWEQDPCAPQMEYDKMAMSPPMAVMSAPAEGGRGGYGVKVEAQFTVGEYEIVILSAKDATGLDRWLKDMKYKIPEGAEPFLRPYVQSGSKFFVAKVDTSKVKFERIGNGPEQAILSPLRFHYDSERFDLPIRLGLINSGGTQDLIVNILARAKRYEAANYPNVTIPTNIDVAETAKDKFGPFYAELFDKTQASKPGAVVTEYAWDASSCDPCPTPALTQAELMTLGLDVISDKPKEAPPVVPMPGKPAGKPHKPTGAPPPSMPPPPPPWFGGGGFVVTRLHARYAKGALGDDLVFREANPIQGGREFMGANGKLEKGAVSGGMNNFQGRYAIRHPWKGPIECKEPHRGVWGGPPGERPNRWGPPPPPRPASKLGYVARGPLELASFVREDIPEIGLKALAANDPAPGGSSAAPVSSAPTAPVGSAPRSGGCAGCSTTSAPISAGSGVLLVLLGFAARLLRRRTT